jgi:predicted DNA-binding transcriptional regulator AlpA
MKGRRFLKMAEVLHIAGCGKTKLREMILKGTFPSPITLPDGRTLLWDGLTVDAWYDAHVAASNASRAIPAPDPLSAFFARASA